MNMAEFTPEGESMANLQVPKTARATGSTGINPVQDSGARGIIAAALGGILTFAQIEWELFSADGLAALIPVTLFLAFILGGLYDKFLKPHLPSS
jgi:hypothetical protein